MLVICLLWANCFVGQFDERNQPYKWSKSVLSLKDGLPILEERARELSKFLEDFEAVKSSFIKQTELFLPPRSHLNTSPSL